MSPIDKNAGKKVYIPSNLYTAILAIALGIVLASIALVAFMCFSQYGTIFTIPG